MNAILISIGTELVSGETVDTNAAYLARELTALGWDVVEHLTIGDVREAIRDAVARSWGRAALVIVTGGLGPTADDVTRDGVAEALGVLLAPHSQAVADLHAFFERVGRRLSPSNERQTLIPGGCELLRNAWGTAPGFKAVRDGCRLYVLPGVPSEMKNMFESLVRPDVAGQGTGRRTVSAALHAFGATESSIGEKIADLMTPGRRPIVGITAKDAIISVRIAATGDDEAAARAALDEDVRTVRQRLGSVVFGEGEATLQSTVAELLSRAGLTVCTAESCTGGLLASWLTDVPGASAYFLCGCVGYANSAKTALLGVPAAVLEAEGAVSEPVAALMAEGARRAAGADLALSVTGIAGPGGGRAPDKPVGLVYIGGADGVATRVRRYLFGDHLSRAEIRLRACRTALNLLRLRLLEGDWR